MRTSTHLFAHTFALAKCPCHIFLLLLIMVTQQFHPVRRIGVLCFLFDYLCGFFFLQAVKTWNNSLCVSGRNCNQSSGTRSQLMMNLSYYEKQRHCSLNTKFQDSSNKCFFTCTYLFSFLGDVAGNLEGWQVLVRPVLFLFNTFLCSV